MNSEIANIKVLQKALSAGLLNDIEDLLVKQAKKDRLFNILRVFGIDELEIRHSFMLKWLLSPKEDHGLGDLFLKLFLKCYVNETEGGNAKKFPERYRALKAVADYNSFVADREVEHIDLLLVSEKEKIVIAIENKWNACERVDTEGKEGQLSEYEKLVSGRFPDHKWNRYFIFLTPDKRSPSKRNIDKWDALGYESVRRSLEQILKDPRITSETNRECKERRTLIEHYYRIVERKLNMEGKDTKEMCTQIYDQYREALDLLFKRADRRDPILRRLEEIRVGDGEFLRVEKSDAVSYVQYKRRLPQKKSNSVHYEVLVGKKECKVALHLERNTTKAIRKKLLKRVADICRKKGVLPIMAKGKRSFSNGVLVDGVAVRGAEIRIERRDKEDDVVEREIRAAMTRMYNMFEPTLRRFEKRKK